MPSRHSCRALVLKLVRIITNLVSKVRAEVGTLVSVPLLLTTRGVPDECRRRSGPLGMERIRFPVSSRTRVRAAAVCGRYYFLVFVDVVGLAFPFVSVLFSGTWAGGHGYSSSSTSPTASS